MTDKTTKDTPRGERIAKVMARAGVASRRDAERMIVAGRVAVNGRAVTSPALDIGPADTVTLDGKPIDAPQPARLWLYYKPAGLVTSAKDEKGRQTVFDTMPEGMPRVMSVGRLDLNSEGLLLLTNDGALKRRLELPETGWLRKYRVRVNGRPNDATFAPLRRGVTVEGEAFLPMEVTLDRQQGANAWLTIGLREGRNREIRRAMGEVGLTVNRLIRVSYGPFRLNLMKPGDVVEVKARVLRAQLGGLAGDAAAGGDRTGPTGGDAATGAGGKKRWGAGAKGSGSARSRPRPPSAKGSGPRGAGARTDRPQTDRPRADGTRADGTRADGTRAEGTRAEGTPAAAAAGSAKTHRGAVRDSRSGGGGLRGGAPRRGGPKPRS